MRLPNRITRVRLPDWITRARPPDWISRQSRGALVGLAFLALAGSAASAVVLEALVRARLDPTRFPAPTRLYARPITLRVGTSADRRVVVSHLERLGYRAVGRSRVRTGEYRLDGWEWIIGQRPFRFGGQLYPGSTVTVQLAWGRQVAAIRDADGRRVDVLTLEPETIHVIAPSGQDRVPVPLSQVPRHLVDAVLAVEDQRFYTHGPLDLRRIGGATVANVRAGRAVQGASTISQQLAKNLFLSSIRSPVRKAREAVMALVLESRYSKDEILEAYLNEVYLGQDGALAIHGVGRAAQYYFGKDVTELGISESALLAGLIRGPSLYSPARHPEAATERRNLVLALMRDQGTIDDDVYREARDTRVRVRAASRQAVAGRYFSDLVAAGLAESERAKSGRGALAVLTTLDLALQTAAERAVRDVLRAAERAYRPLTNTDSPLQAALVALDPRTGEVLAMAGGRDYGASQFNRAVLARRQPGSAFKPLVALAALSPGEVDGAGRRYTLASLLDDEPLAVQTPAGLWEPMNYDGRFRGQVTLRDALERSLNVPFARLGMAVGPQRIVEAAKGLGITSPLRAVPSIALGSSEVTPLELTRAYGVFAAGGVRAELQTVLAVIDWQGKVVDQFEMRRERVIRPGEAYLVTAALRGAAERGTGRALASYGYHGPIAAKSGTTNDHRDAWFIAFTPTLAVGVWVGFDDGKSVGLPGSKIALPIVARVLLAAGGGDGGPDFPVPDDVEVVDIDPQSGLRAGPGCWGEPEFFLRGTAPEESCSSIDQDPWWRAGGSWRAEARALAEHLRRLAMQRFERSRRGVHGR